MTVDLQQMVAGLKVWTDTVTQDNQGDHLGSSYLGPSVIGGECDRKAWYRWRWYQTVFHEARILRLFARGNEEEPRVIRRLRDAGVEVWEKDDAGEQFGGQDLGGHFRWRSDGIVGLQGMAPGVLEVKTMNAKNYNAMMREGGNPPPAHVDQTKLYIAYLGLTWGLYVAVCKDNDDWHWVGIPADPARAEYGRIRASNLIAAQGPPPRIATTPAFYLCKMCDYRAVCHEGAAPVVSCRSCVHGTPVDGGRWACRVLPTYPIRTPRESREMGKTRNHMPCKGLQWQRIPEAA